MARKAERQAFRAAGVGWFEWAVHWIILSALLQGCALFHRPSEDVLTVRAQSLSLQASDACRRGDWTSAREWFDEAIKACPTDVQTRRRYAEALWDQGLVDDSLNQMKEAVRLSADAPEVLIRYGRLLVSAGRTAEADAVSRRAVARFPSNAQALALRGAVLQQRGAYDEAMSIYHQALRRQPDYPQVKLALAEIAHRRGQHQRCLATLSALKEDYPQGRIPWQVDWLEGLALHDLDRFAEAAERFSHVASSGNASAEVLYREADAWYRAGRYRRAWMAAQELARSFPDYEPGRALHAELASLPTRLR